MYLHTAPALSRYYDSLMHTMRCFCLQEVSGTIGPFLTWLLMQDREVVRLKLTDTTVQVWRCAVSVLMPAM